MELHPHQYDELQFLRYFYNRAEEGMGPASDDIYQMIKEDYINKYEELPEGYEIKEEE